MKYQLNDYWVVFSIRDAAEKKKLVVATLRLAGPTIVPSRWWCSGMCKPGFWKKNIFYRKRKKLWNYLACGRR